jgi:hypothetical protein
LTDGLLFLVSLRYYDFDENFPDEKLRGTVSRRNEFGRVDKRTVHAGYLAALFGICTLKAEYANVKGSKFASKCECGKERRLLCAHQRLWMGVMAGKQGTNIGYQM